MFQYSRQPVGKADSWSSLLKNVPEQPIEGDFPRLGDIPLQREKTLVEELFSFDGPPDATVSVGGQDYYYFSGEGYLGLQANPEVLAATCEAVLIHGTSLGTIRHRFTPSPVFEVENKVAEIYGTDRAYYIYSERNAIEQLLESIAETVDKVYIDEMVLDSTVEAVRLALASHCREPIFFHHRDTAHLESVLRKTLPARSRPLIVTDGVFNVNGAIAPIPEYYELLSQYPDSAIFIDDSDAFGILGEKGRGTLEYFNYDYSAVNRTKLDSEGDTTFGIDSIDYWSNDDGDPLDLDYLPFPSEEASSSRSNRNDFIFLEPEQQTNTAKRPLLARTYLITSLSRAIGGFGATIPGSERFIDRLKGGSQNLVSPMFPPTPLAAATYKGLQLSYHCDMIRHRLWNNVYYFKSEIEKLGIPTEQNMVPIVAIRAGSNGNMRRLQCQLIDRQILVSFLQQLNSRHREGALRVALLATHERETLNLFLQTLKEIL